MRSGRVAYRVTQFARAFTTKMGPQEPAELERLLNHDELALFYGMSKAALRHGLLVFRQLRRQGCDDSQLLTAALLHDVGKSRVSLAHRVVGVLLGMIWPTSICRMASANGRGWRRGFYEHLYHPELGARMVLQAGSQPRVVELIRRHHAGVEGGPQGLSALRMADEGS
ncbi:MAG: HD domain-containing protein [Dehalococcoidia bacterium]|nr:HD domain-containing protein [Dehalococcoidia bacterium]